MSKLYRKDIKVGVYLQCPNRQDAVRLVLKTKKHVFHSAWLSLRDNGMHRYYGIEKHEYANFENSDWYVVK